MRIHSDKLEFSDLGLAAANAGFGPDVYYERTAHGSRKRAHAFDVSADADPGEDRHGIKRAFRCNTGTIGAQSGEYKALTWVEWGDWICQMFKIDPAAIIGSYDGAKDFVSQTTQMAPHRPARENAETHAARWADELDARVIKGSRVDTAGARGMVA